MIKKTNTAYSHPMFCHVSINELKNTQDYFKYNTFVFNEIITFQHNQRHLNYLLTSHVLI